ncbi:MAG: hypothetical protein JWM68_2421, partial [Verrucomicrobiales bacterium]|nr:hypothetical protein [Verrucomicrobiales bacterium]
FIPAGGKESALADESVHISPVDDQRRVNRPVDFENQWSGGKSL